MPACFPCGGPVCRWSVAGSACRRWAAPASFVEPRWLNRCGRADVVAVIEPAAVPGWLLFPPREPSPGTAAVRDPGGEHPVADSPAPGLAQARVGGTAARWRTDGLTTREAPWIDAPGVTLPPCPYC